jgi:Tfp pilus assembly protein PilF
VRLVPLALTASLCFAQDTTAEKLIEAGHWKRARAIVEQRLREAPDDARATFLLSQIRAAFGDRTSPLQLAEKAVRLDGTVARYHRQLAEVQGLIAERSSVFQQVMLARRFRKEIDAAMALDPRDVQAKRDLLEFYLVAPGIVGGDSRKADAVAAQIATVDPSEGFLAKARLAEYHKDYAQAEAMLRRAAEVRPPSYRAHLALARFYLKPPLGNPAAAELWGRAAVALDAGRSGGYEVLASVYAARCDWNSLDSVLAAAEQEVPDDYSSYCRAAEQLLAGNRQPARAAPYLRIYLTQPAEGNQPTADDAQLKLSLLTRNGGTK